MKRSAIPPIRGLHLDQPLASVGSETGDIVSSAITVFLRHPSDLLHQVPPSGIGEHALLMLKDTLLTSLA
jgi:hypothetical protein